MPLTQKQVADAIAASADSPKSIKLADGRSLYLVARRGRGFWVYQFRGRNKADTEDATRSKGLALLWQIYSRRCSLQIHFLQCGHCCDGSRAMSSRMAWRTAGKVG